MAPTYIPRTIPKPHHRRYTIKFYRYQIETIVTKEPDVVSAWIHETEQIYSRHLKRLIVGLDTEWQLRFNGNKDSKVAILQICVGSRCLIFQIIHSSMVPPSLVNFMKNPNYTFTGVGVYDDVVKLRNDYGLGYEAQVMDLRRLAEKIYGPSSSAMGLKRLTGLVLGKHIEKPKHITMSSWGRHNLSYEQVEYACLDAFVSFEIARILLVKSSSHDCTLESKSCLQKGMYLTESMFQI